MTHPDPAKEGVSPLKKSEAFVFDKGCLVLKVEGYPEPETGNGYIAMSEKNLQWDQDDQTGKWSAWVSICKDDLEEMRDFLNRVLPIASPSRVREETIEECIDLANELDDCSVAYVVERLHSLKSKGPGQ